MASIWSLDTEFPQMESLQDHKKTEVAVIGGGIAGLLIAYVLQSQDIETVVLEANRIVSGQTLNTTAKITSQHNLIYNDLINDFGLEIASAYAAANEKAIEMYANIIENENIECNFTRLPAYVYTLDDVSKIEEEVESAQKVGIRAEFTRNTSLPFDVKGSVKFSNQATFNPLEFLREIIKNLTIYENTKVREVEENKVITNKGTVTANHIVVASHYPFINAPGYYFLRMHQERSYVLALENASKLDGMYIDEADNGFSFRNYKDKLLLGGPGHRTGDNQYGGYYDILKSAAIDFYPNSREVCRWSAQDCVTIDNIPYIGQYSAATPNLYVATGFKKWGMTSSMVSAMIIKDLILGNDNPYAKAFNPQRFKITASMKTLTEDVKHTSKGLVLDKLKIPKKTLKGLKRGQGQIIEFEGEKLGIYKNEDDKMYAVSPYCAHLGCELKWNYDELSWDCPCHGSRYDYKGNLLDNPAKEGIDITFDDNEEIKK